MTENLSAERLEAIAERPSVATPAEIRWMVEKVAALSGEVRSLRNTYEGYVGESLTKAQANLLMFLREYIEERGFAPSCREICDRFGWRSLATAHEHLGNLEKKGWIRREFNKQRAITLVLRSATDAEVGHG